MKVTAYRAFGSIEIRPASKRRAWIDQLPRHYGYQCLPLSIGSQYGWEFPCPYEIRATLTNKGIEIKKGADEKTFADNHFGGAMLSFYPGFVLRTDPGWNLMVCGPANSPKRGAHPLTAVIESDWASYSFSMNWILTEIGHQVTFEEGEAFGRIFPIQRHAIESVEGEIKPIESNPEIQAQYQQWRSNRKQTLEDAHPEMDHNYLKGRNADGGNGTPDHRTNLLLRPFENID